MDDLLWDYLMENPDVQLHASCCDDRWTFALTRKYSDQAGAAGNGSNRGEAIRSLLRAVGYIDNRYDHL
jgi:hypothetical protein